MKGKARLINTKISSYGMSKVLNSEIHEKYFSRSSCQETGAQVFKGYIVDVPERSVFPGEIHVMDGVIVARECLESVPEGSPFYLPGFTDAHIHIESSMMIPENFAKVAVTHGVVNAVCDPHEIANVLGVPGIEFMIENARNSRFNFCFGLPSCVPSSHLETAGAVIDAGMTEELIKREDLHFLAEMMNYPGVIFGDSEVMRKIEAARKAGKKIDGHAPGVTGEDIAGYASAGITTDHECVTLAEAREKVKNGMKIIVREGSAARNFDVLYPIIDESPENTMLCSDDRHPDDLVNGHIDDMVRRGIGKGLQLWNILDAACVNPVKHYGLPACLMQKGDRATFIAVDNLTDFEVQTTVIDGHIVYDRCSGVNAEAIACGNNPVHVLNNFVAGRITEKDIAFDIPAGRTVNVIVAKDGELITSREKTCTDMFSDSMVQKLIVYNRYGNGTPKVGFIKGFGLEKGAFGTTVAHDSHNIVATGASDAEIVQVINTLIGSKGGLCVSCEGNTDILPLPIAGIMSPGTGEEISVKYRQLDKMVKLLGCRMKSPFITLSFMALPVIKDIKLTDKGLVDVNAFDFISLVE